MPGQIDRRAAVVLVMLAAIGAALASGVALTDDDANPNTGPAPVSTNVPGPSPAPALPPAAPAIDPGRTAVDADAPAPPAASANAAIVPPAGGAGDPRANDAAVSGRPRTPAATAAPVGGASRNTTATAAPRTDSSSPASPGRVDAGSPAAGPPPAAAAQVAPRAPSIYVDCQGFADVCAALRTEMTRAFQRDGLDVTRDAGAADIAIAAAVTLVAETTSAPFGTPIVTRTYSVELDGDARGASLAMPDPRRFSFDPRIGSERLAENARLIAADAAQSVRTFRARTQP
jgi:hypothetical protein